MKDYITVQQTEAVKKLGYTLTQWKKADHWRLYINAGRHQRGYIDMITGEIHESGPRFLDDLNKIKTIITA